ncbi:MAG TPA: hypothetical protein VM536_16115 [Chloroflexia bacterium]|nr:hypothetical protein [Chloroflexia bacterium]
MPNTTTDSPHGPASVTQAAAETELTDEDLEQVAGGGCLQWIDSVGCSLDSN